MATVVLTKGQTVVAGLGSWALTTTTAGMHTVIVQTIMNRDSSVIATIAQSGSTSVSVSSLIPGASQRHVDLSAILNIVPGDVITVSLASSAAIDNQLNTVKTIINIHTGTV